jgi:L-serine deaminase
MYEPPRLISITTINSIYGGAPTCNLGCAIIAVAAAVGVGIGAVAVAVANVGVAANAIAVVNVFASGSYTLAGASDPRLLHMRLAARGLPA